MSLRRPDAQPPSPVAQAADAYNPMKEFDLVDGDGMSHHYEMLPHPATEGQEIMWQLIAFGGEPLGALAQSIVASADQERGLAGVLDDPKILEHIDWSALGREIASSVSRLNMSALSSALLKHTIREGQPLSNPVVFNGAYQANYGELLKALWEVTRRNNFLPL